MAKKKARTQTVQQAPDRGARICFERVLPDEVDPERAVRRAMRQFVASSTRGKLNAEAVAEVARMALVNSKKWPTGSTIKCRFLDGSKKMQKGVEGFAHKWEEHANINFKFVTTGTAEIRISFYADDGSWSAVGRDALNQAYFPSHQPTMNYGWLRDGSSTNEYSSVVYHEFGHALGCIHEHQAPTFKRKWDKKAVLKYFQGPPNYWSPQDVDHNVLSKYSPTGIKATRYDPKSIMLYSFDGDLFADGLGPTNENVKPSATDLKMIKQMYP